jgi:hypothetical protein
MVLQVERNIFGPLMELQGAGRRSCRLAVANVFQKSTTELHATTLAGPLDGCEEEMHS